MRKILLWAGGAALASLVGGAVVMLGLERHPPGPGAHVVLAVDMAGYWHGEALRLRRTLGLHLRAERLAYSLDEVADDAVTLHMRDPAQAAQVPGALKAFAAEWHDGLVISEPEAGTFKLAFAPGYRRETEGRVAVQTMDVLQRRLNAAGLRPSTVRSGGAGKIVIGVEGRPDRQALATLLATPGVLSFRLVDESGERALPLKPHPALPGETSLPFDGQDGRLLVFDKVLLGGDHIMDANTGFDGKTGEPVVTLRFDADGTKTFAVVTASNTDNRFAVVMDGKILLAPVIREPILGGSVQIDGSFTTQHASQIATLLRGGGLPAPLRVIETGEGLPK